ncbi:MAG: hypothetical protein ABIJ19_01155 [Patescibacteria group bacterium]
MTIRKLPKQTKSPRKVTGAKRITKRTKKKTGKKKQASILGLKRAKENPIISPKSENNWEAWQVFNPSAILLNNKVHFLYRAIGEDGISRLGYAASKDGFTIGERLSCPVYEHKLTRPVFNYYSFASGGSFGGAEDPRIVRVNEEDALYLTYTACNEGLGVALTSIKVDDFLNRRWKWKPPQLISRPGEVHKNWVIFPEKIQGKYAILHSICPEISIAYHDSLDFPQGEYIESYYNGNARRKKCWDNWLRGAGAPPIKTRLGWLLFYQAMDENDPGKYKVGAMILGAKDPTEILYRAPESVLEPERDYENNGFKAGVVYVTGAVVNNGELLVYYGASDSYVAVAHADLEEFLGTLTKEAKPKLKAKTLRKKQYDY